MPHRARIALFCALGMIACSQTACNMVPRSQLTQAQLQSRRLYEQNKALMAERDGMSRGMAEENQRLQQQLADSNASNSTLQRRVDNLLSERGQLQTRFSSMKNQSSPLSAGSTRQFEELARKYPDFEFDPNTGVSKFKTDLLFQSGSDQLRPEAEPMLRDFAKILNQGDAQRLNILVVGHTDNQRVVKPETKAKHPDNWYLSAHRAVSVTHALGKHGLKENRLGVAGYGPYQPIATGSDPKSREKNRRVEIFVLAPNASMAGWDPGTIKK